MVIMTLIALGLGYMNYLGSTTEEKIGSKQTEIFDSFQESRETLLGLDTITKFAGIDSIYSLAMEGGFSSNPPCGDYYGVPLWSYRNPEDEYTECIPEPTEEIIKPFSENFKDNLPKNQDYRNEYEFFSYQNASFHIAAFPSEKNKIDIGSGKNRTYSYRPSVNKRFDYNLSTYRTIEELQSFLNKKCSSKENTDDNKNLRNCVYDNTKKFSEDHEISISVIRPHNEFSEERLSKELFKESLEYVDETTYLDCYAQTLTTKKKVDKSYELKNAIGKDFSLFEDSRFDPFFFRGQRGEKTPQIIEREEEIYYHPQTDQINPNDDSLEFNHIYKNKKGEGIILEEYPTVKHFFPCPHEKRKYLFKITKPELYPVKGNLTYRFALYINDSAPPEFKDLNIRDKEFDQGNLLVTWKHTDSKDLENYTVYVNGELKKTIKPWKNVKTRTYIDWEGGDGKPYDTCTLSDNEGYKECLYKGLDSEFTLEERKVYYFKENNQFVYVLHNIEDNREYDIKVTAKDDDLNKFSLKSSGGSIDDLPLNPLGKSNYMIFPMCEPETQVYGSVMANPLIPVLRDMKGSEDNEFSQQYVLFEDVRSNVVNTNKGKPVLTTPGLVGLNKPHHITDKTPYLLVPKDPSLDNLDKLYLDKMGYQKKIPYSCWSK